MKGSEGAPRAAGVAAPQDDLGSLPYLVARFRLLTSRLELRTLLAPDEALAVNARDILHLRNLGRALRDGEVELDEGGMFRLVSRADADACGRTPVILNQSLTPEWLTREMGHAAVLLTRMGA